MQICLFEIKYCNKFFDSPTTGIQCVQDKKLSLSFQVTELPAMVFKWQQ